MLSYGDDVFVRDHRGNEVADTILLRPLGIDGFEQAFAMLEVCFGEGGVRNAARISRIPSRGVFQGRAC